MSETLLSHKIVVDDLPPTGTDVVLEPDAALRERISRELQVRNLPAFSARLHVQPRAGGRVIVSGEVRARVGQTCVVSLEPMESVVREVVEVEFAPPELIAREAEEIDIEAEQSDPPDPIDNGQIDVGALALEFLALGIDPYPRRPEAHFSTETPGPEAVSPFAALLRLKPGEGTSGT